MRGKHGSGPKLVIDLGEKLKSKLMKYCDLQGLIPNKYCTKIIRDFFEDVNDEGIQVVAEEPEIEE